MNVIILTCCKPTKTLVPNQHQSFINWFLENRLGNETIFLWKDYNNSWNKRFSLQDSLSSEETAKNIITYENLVKWKDNYPSILLKPLDSFVSNENDVKYLLHQNNVSKIKLTNKSKNKKIKLLERLPKSNNWLMTNSIVYLSKPMFGKDNKYCFIGVKTENYYEGSSRLEVYENINNNEWKFIASFPL